MQGTNLGIGEGVLVESELGAKALGISCQLHVVERLDDMAMCMVHGPTTSPKEGVSKHSKNVIKCDHCVWNDALQHQKFGLSQA